MRKKIAMGMMVLFLNVFPVAVVAAECTPTAPDQLGPYYAPGAPERSSVGTGYVLEGTVRSASDCSPVPGAKVEFWLAGPAGRYGDAWRATVIAGTSGEYRFESHFPPVYYGRPPHIHIRVSAPGFRTLVTQHYPSTGSAQAFFDLVLKPSR